MLAGEVIFGGKGVRYDNHAFQRSLEALVGELGVREAVHFLGQRDDVPEVLRALDLSLLPSWEEPFGLVTVESMAVGTPPLVSARRGRPRAGRGRRDRAHAAAEAPGGLGAARARELLAATARRWPHGASAGPAAAARFTRRRPRAARCWPSTSARSASAPRCPQPARRDDGEAEAPWPG